MLDGLDELESNRHALCVQAINQLMADENPPLYLVVCSRSEEYGNLVKASEIKLQLNGAIALQPLTDDQIQAYLTTVQRTDLWQTLTLDRPLLELVRTPLFLEIFGQSSTTFDIEHWRSLHPEVRLEYLLDIYVLERLEMEIESTAYFKHKPPTTRKTRHWLVHLAQQLKREAQTEFLIEKMQPQNWLLVPKKKWEYRLVGWLMIVLMVVLISIPTGVVHLMERSIVELLFSIVVLVICGLIVGLPWLAGGMDNNQWYEPRGKPRSVFRPKGRGMYPKRFNLSKCSNFR